MPRAASKVLRETNARSALACADLWLASIARDPEVLPRPKALAARWLRRP